MEPDLNTKIFNRKRLELVANSLSKNNFETKVFDDINSAIEYILSLVGENKKVGLGGSQSVVSLQLKEKLEKNKNSIITHHKEMSLSERKKVWLEAQKADFYFASPQAITLKGEMIFLDAYGNRVSSVIYGPGKVVLIVGYNKVVEDFNMALGRCRNIAAVKNNIRLSKKNPCANTGKCEDCNSKERICNVLTVLYKKPTYTDYVVILVNKELGF